MLFAPVFLAGLTASLGMAPALARFTTLPGRCNEEAVCPAAFKNTINSCLMSTVSYKESPDCLKICEDVDTAHTCMECLEEVKYDKFDFASYDSFLHEVLCPDTQGAHDDDDDDHDDHDEPAKGGASSTLAIAPVAVVLGVAAFGWVF